MFWVEHEAVREAHREVEELEQRLRRTNRRNDEGRSLRQILTGWLRAPERRESPALVERCEP